MAKVIAIKLDLTELSEWIDQELNGYTCSMDELPDHRKVGGSPRFWNPYRGWCPILSDNERLSNILTTGYLPNPVAQLVEWSAAGGTLTYRYPHGIQEYLNKHGDMPMQIEAVMHISSSQVSSALDFVRNKVLAWTLELERRGITGEGFSFRLDQKQEAAIVTNHIYGGNIGVLGNVGGDANSSHFVSSSGVDVGRLKQFVEQALPAAAGLDAATREKALPLLEELQAEADGQPEPSRVGRAITSLRAVLEGASGNLVASAILGALSGSLAA